LAVGRVDVEAVLAELTPERLAFWHAFYDLEPWGGARDDLRAGLVASLLNNAWFKSTKTPADWFPNLGESRPTMTPQEAAAKAKAWVQATGGKVN